MTTSYLRRASTSFSGWNFGDYRERMGDLPQPPDAMILHERDNVATALRALKKGERLCGDRGPELVLTRDIPFGHKLAICAIGSDEDVYKYGLSIGRATAAVFPGDLVHTHNLVTNQDRDALET